MKNSEQNEEWRPWLRMETIAKNEEQNEEWRTK